MFDCPSSKCKCCLYDVLFVCLPVFFLYKSVCFVWVAPEIKENPKNNDRRSEPVGENSHWHAGDAGECFPPIVIDCHCTYRYRYSGMHVMAIP